MKKVVLFVCCLLIANTFCMECDFSPEKKYKAQVSVALLKREVIPALIDEYVKLQKVPSGHPDSCSSYSTMGGILCSSFQSFLKVMILSMNSAELFDCYRMLSLHELKFPSTGTPSDLYALVEKMPKEEKNIFVLEMLKPYWYVTFILNSHDAIKILFGTVYKDINEHEISKYFQETMGSILKCGFKISALKYILIERKYIVSTDDFTKLWNSDLRDIEIINAYIENGGQIPVHLSSDVKKLLPDQ